MISLALIFACGTLAFLMMLTAYESSSLVDRMPVLPAPGGRFFSKFFKMLAVHGSIGVISDLSIPAERTAARSTG